MEQDQSGKQQSFEHAIAQNSKQDEQRGIDDAGCSGGGGGGGEERREAASSIEAEMRNAAQSENRGTAASGHVAECHLLLNSGQQLSEVPVEYVLEPLEAAKGIEIFQDQVRVNRHRALINIPGQAAQVETPNQLQSPDGPSSSELSPTSVTQSISSIPSPTRQEQKLPPVENRVLACVPEIERQNSLNQKSLSVLPVLKKPSHDGYNWRKYGQKQVKSPQGSRSYYRCTYSDCYAKKIECSDHTSRVIEIVYKSQHNHDPPRKVSSSPESRPALSANPVNGLNSTAHSVTPPNDSVPSNSLKDAVKEMAPANETKEQSAGSSDDDSETTVREEDIDEPETRKRQKKSSLDCSGTLSKPGKKPKFVVHAAGDVGISGDGYRWRKYGQKMVKGNPHPRNYYRCTSAGCPVRKHIERAVDDTNSVVITYKGIHDHDMPVPRKRQGLPNAPLVAASAPASMSNSEVKKSDQLQNRISTTKWSVDNKGELTGETLEPGGENAIESAKTLLSIGFEIKPC